LICKTETNFVSEVIANEISKISMDDIESVDVDGNNSLHLLAYCGHSCMLESIFKKFGNTISSSLINAENKKKETPLTLSIKSRGFYKVLKELMKNGATIPESRNKSLEK